MQMTFRWYGEGNDSITQEQIRQIPGVTGLVWALHDKPAGEVWEIHEIEKMRQQIEGHGFHMEVVESVNVHDDIKIGLPSRDRYIETYKQTLRNLSKFGVKVVTYNFMPIFDWTRTDLFHPLEDGSTALYYEKDKIMPVCHETGIRMAIHPDDPPWDIFGLPRLLVDKASIERFLAMAEDDHNCLCLCSGSLVAAVDNDIPDQIRSPCSRIAFAHIRNVKHYPNGDFSEVSHRDCDGDVGILEIMRAYHDCGFDGYIRPDHGRHIWGEECRPGYGLYDRALGIMYMWGCWDMLERMEGKK